jgi:hypothetical protein
MWCSPHSAGGQLLDAVGLLALRSGQHGAMASILLLLALPLLCPA